jgi:hypothetical protein
MVEQYLKLRDDIDLVILDVLIPLLDGQETLEALQRLDGGYPGARFHGL